MTKGIINNEGAINNYVGSITIKGIINNYESGTISATNQSVTGIDVVVSDEIRLFWMRQ